MPYRSFLSVFMTKNTPSGAKKSIAKEPNQKVTRRPKCFSFFFRWASSNLRDFHDGFCTKQHFSLSSALAHRFFPGLKSREAIRTAH